MAAEAVTGRERARIGGHAGFPFFFWQLDGQLVGVGIGEDEVFPFTGNVGSSPRLRRPPRHLGQPRDDLLEAVHVRCHLRASRKASRWIKITGRLVGDLNGIPSILAAGRRDRAAGWPVQHSGHPDAELEPGEMHSQALVATGPERDVGLRIAVGVEACRILVAALVVVGGSRATDDRRPLRTWRPRFDSLEILAVFHRDRCLPPEDLFDHASITLSSKSRAITSGCVSNATRCFP